MELYFAALGQSTRDLRTVPVDGVGDTLAPAGTPPSPADLEVLPAVQIADSLTSGATILRYFVPNTEPGAP